MDIAIVTLDGFNELDSLVAMNILGRMRDSGWNPQITGSASSVTSMNGVEVKVQQPLAFANQADVVLFGSGTKTRLFAGDGAFLSQFHLDPQRQLVGAQCSGALLLASLGLLQQLPACTDSKTRPSLMNLGVNVLEQPFYASGNIATAGGCLSSVYLAAWVIVRLAGVAAARSVLQTVAPIGEKQTTTEHCLATIGA